MLRKCMNTWQFHAVHMSPALNRSSALKHCECDNEIEICDGNFYLGLSQTCKTLLVILYRAGALCRTLSKNWVASSIWRYNHEPVHWVSNCQNPSIMLSPCACVEKLNTRVVNHTCNELNMSLRVDSLTTFVAISYTPKCINRVQKQRKHYLNIQSNVLCMHDEQPY